MELVDVVVRPASRAASCSELRLCEPPGIPPGYGQRVELHTIEAFRVVAQGHVALLTNAL